MNAQKQILVIGGGFGGLHAVRALRRAPMEITLVDRENYHLFQPLLYQVATGGLSPADIASPLRSVLRRQRNVRTLMGEAVDIDPERRLVQLKDGRLSYDTLIVATGARHNYFGHDEWERLAPGLKTVDDATAIRARLLAAFERAERESSPEERRALMTIVIVGGGPTGAELAGAIAEISRDTLRQDFRAIDPSATRIILVQGGERILQSYPESLSSEAHRALESLGVEVRVGGYVTAVTDAGVTITRGDRTEQIATRTTLWAAGVRASSFGRRLAKVTGAQVDDVGRIVVDPLMNIPGHPNIFVIGDLACYTDESGEPLPGVAQVAMQQGRHVARVITDRLRQRETAPFRYRDFGYLATIGRSRAVAVFGSLKLSGFFAWLIWLFIHLMKLVGYENRLLVFVQWAVNYLTFNRSARLITGRSGVDRALDPEPVEQSANREG